MPVVIKEMHIRTVVEKHGGGSFGRAYPKD